AGPRECPVDFLSKTEIHGALTRPRSPEPHYGSAALALAQFLEQSIDGLVHLRTTHALVADHALGVDHIDRREILDVPVGEDAGTRAGRARRAGVPVDPRHRLFLQELLE